MEWDSQKLFSKEMIVMNLMSNSVLIGKIIMLLVLKYWNLHAFIGFSFLRIDNFINGNSLFALQF